MKLRTEWTDLAKTDQHAAKVVEKYYGRSEFELFDLQQDPSELTNLAGKPELAQVQQRLFTNLKAWMKEQGDQLTVFHEPLMLDAPETWVSRKRNKK